MILMWETAKQPNKQFQISPCDLTFFQYNVFCLPIQMCDFVETHFLDEQVKSIKQLADWISNLRRMGAPQNGMAEYLFDKHTMGMEAS